MTAGPYLRRAEPATHEPACARCLKLESELAVAQGLVDAIGDRLLRRAEEVRDLRRQLVAHELEVTNPLEARIEALKRAVQELRERLRGAAW